jgi:magnesium transporter
MTNRNDTKRILITREQGWQVAHNVRRFIAEGHTDGLRNFLNRFYPVDIALALQMLDDKEKETVFRLLDVDDKAEVLDEVDAETEEHLVRTTDAETLSDILEEMPADEGADLVQAMDEEQAEEVLRLMDKEEAEDLQEIMQHPPDSAGGIMTVEFVAVPDDVTAAQAIEVIRESAQENSYSYVYVVDDKGTLKGVLDLRKLILAKSDTLIRDIVTHGIVFVFADQDQEEVAEVVARYDLLSLPVVDRHYKLLGIVTAHDAIDVIHQESTEDIYRIGGLHGDFATELEHKAPMEIAHMRLLPLLMTLGLSLVSAFVISRFNRSLSQFVLLAVIMPVISAMSGNIGLQSATIVVRGLATGDILPYQWARRLGRELLVALCIGVVCGVTLGAIAAGWSVLWGEKWQFGLIVAIAMTCTMTFAGLLGTLLPFVFHRLGKDPAIVAGPFTTTTQDIVGFGTFLGLATLLIHWLK